MFLSNTQPSVHLTGKLASGEEAQLPRGECGYIQPVSEPSSTSRQRCSCRSFYPDPIVRSRCGCGHQAWHHETQPLSVVSVDQFLQVVEQMKLLKHEVRRHESIEEELRRELLRERAVREEHFRTYKVLEARLYENMRLLKMTMDDRVEAVVDRTSSFSNQIRDVQQRLTMVDEITMDLENRVDKVEHANGRSRDDTPVESTPKPHLSTPKASPIPQIPLLMQSQHTLGQLPIRTDKKYPLSWNVRVIFVLRKSQRFAYDPDSAGYRRCASRKLQQNLDFVGQDSAYFAARIEDVFRGILRGRPWMPLVGHRPPDEPFGRIALTLLPPNLIHRELWDHPFVEDHCIAHDKMQGDVLYIALQHEDATWNEVRFLPPVLGIDEACWSHDEELDGTAEYKSLDTEIMYDCQDPPPTYSSRTHSLADRAPSKLDVLADSAAMLGPIERARTQSSTHPSMSRPSLERAQTASSSHSNHRFSSERSSLRSFDSEMGEDEHRDKKPKLRSKDSAMNVVGTGHAQHPMYVSGRSKRKMPVKDKGQKEPLHFSVTNVTKWRPSLLHPHSSKGKEIAHSQ
ncbi:uncharacterized protein EKO05_0003435 [Ascochyta rabiei]|uniref:Uncharacterized protein n=1 Tax=Didymella rabiei TaxID=5454 RepID=A0A163EB62_DIDRA|nr:uncharacterized protein EKO05_0003435 [Ascochyta rabiei]KZM23611.1 hypothetical protein ST47_g5251 [Ascochyta rabiei]UPX12902.1 hypothetical protein EKO05_0003435 [Ascochyta rabiei]